MIEGPSDAVGNGRDTGGRFAAGNRLARGNPHGKRVNELRSALFAAVSPDDLRQVVESLVQQAKAGNVPAARELLDRCLGRPEALDLLERLEHVEALLEAAAAERRA